jgi:histidinol dehydrogenase
MLGVPAMVAECKELIVCTPPNPNAAILYACNLIGARVFSVGGAQAIAAMAYGTESIPKVDKIFGPGNRFVTEAKVQVSAQGNPIDMPAGPSEVLVIADETSNPAFVAADLLSQAEHGVDSQVVVIGTSEDLLDKVIAEVENQLKTLPRKSIAEKCLENSIGIVVNGIERAIEISNIYAPEHLILSFNKANSYIDSITNAGSVFLGQYTPESAGDYSSGTNHTLPTSGFAKNWSGVTVNSFLKTITYQEITRDGLSELSTAITTLARAEGLEAHAKAVDVRTADGKTQRKSQKVIRFRSNIANLKPYSSARSECNAQGLTLLDANENPEVLPGIHLEYNRYPDPLQKDIKKRIAEIKKVSENQIFLGNGSDEAVDLLIRCFCNPKTDAIATFTPTYGMYSVCASINDIKVKEYRLNDDFAIYVDEFLDSVTSDVKVVFICNPNNPTGNTQNLDDIIKIIEEFDGIVVVDEAYIDFCEDKTLLPYLNQYPNLVILQTFSKAWGLAGARLGLAFASTEIIGVLNKVKFPYNVGKPSLTVLDNALKNYQTVKEKITNLIAERKFLAKELSQLSTVVKVYPSESNFLLVKTNNADLIYNQLLDNGIVVRNRSKEPGCDGCLRITVGSEVENRSLIEILKKVVR